MRHPVTVKLNSSRQAQRNAPLAALFHTGDPVSLVRFTMIVPFLCVLQSVCFVSASLQSKSELEAKNECLFAIHKVYVLFG